ncbi:MAG: tetratricopeptide repeat protein [Planctomycetota bacterium]|nr:MAG: tetratricopeptide repeat protein [Planctomycetota bacterium]
MTRPAVTGPDDFISLFRIPDFLKMAIELDPSRWLVSLAGFVYDWIISREWKRILTGLIPTAILLTVVGVVWWGSTINRLELADRYMRLADSELAEWERSWAGAAAMGPAESGSSDAVAPVSAGSAASEHADPGTEGLRPISDFAEALARRVQLLAPSDRSQYWLGASMIQHGAVDRGVKLLEKVAPLNRAGYDRAHAFLSLVYLDRLRKEKDANQQRAWVDAFLHHVAHAKAWAPDSALWAASDLLWIRGQQRQAAGMPQARDDLETAVKYLEQAAETNPDAALELARRAAAIEDRLTVEQAIPKAERHYRDRLADNPRDARARVRLAETLVLDKRLEEAEEVLQQGLAIEKTPELARGLSELYRIRFHATLRNPQGADLRLLEMAMRYDPTNPKIYEETAALIRLGGQPSEALQEQLEQMLVQGLATGVTHLLLSESYLLRQDYEAAIPHLEQVITRLPQATAALNNLAWVLAELHPERLDEALDLSRRAIAASRYNPNPDYYDTLGLIHTKMGNLKEAVAAYETAIELDRQRSDFHQKLAEIYKQLGNDRLAELHAVQATLLTDAAAVPSQPPDAEEEASADDPSAESPDDRSQAGASTEPGQGDQVESTTSPKTGDAAASETRSTTGTDASTPDEPDAAGADGG